MTRNRFNQPKHQWQSMSGGPTENPLLGSTSTSTNNLTLSKARGLFLEDNDNIDMKDTKKLYIIICFKKIVLYIKTEITTVHPPIAEKDVIKKEYCDNNL